MAALGTLAGIGSESTGFTTHDSVGDFFLDVRNSVPGRKKRVKRTLPDLLDFEITHKTHLPFCQKDWKKPSEHLMPDVRI